ncbi:MAG: AraC family transcriptional regulator [Mycobacterium sp.]|nr:AraC family transcriptional regulator [Mycobacterium sp.]
MTAVLDNVSANAHPEAQSAGPPGQVNCLASYRRFRTNDREYAETETAKLLSPHRLQVSNAAEEFDAALSWASLGAVSICLFDSHSSVSIDRPAPARPDYMTVVTPMSGHVLVRHRKQEFIARPQQAQAALSWGDSMHMEVSANSAVLVMRAEMAALTEALSTLAPEAEGPLRFTSAIANPRSCHAISGTMEMLLSVLDNFGSVDAIPAHLCRQLREHALNTVLLTVPHNQSEHIFRPRRPSRGAVRQAVDLLENEVMGELTISDIAKRVGVGVRALEIGFQREMHCTPRAFMLTRRMERAHQELEDADPRSGSTVTGIAMRWGFAHTGRFATTYRRRYGLAPSQTLRQGGRNSTSSTSQTA